MNGNTYNKYFLTWLLFTLFALPCFAVKVKRSGAIDLLAVDKRYFYQHELHLYALPNYNRIAYSDAANHHSEGDFNVGAGIDYRFFFHQNVGVSLGLQYLPYSSSYKFDNFEQNSSGIDNSDPLYPNNPYTYTEIYNVTEVARLHYMEVPIKFLFITPSWNRVQLRTGIGLSLGYNIASNQSLSGYYDARMIYTDNHITLDQSESLMLGRYNDIAIQSPRSVLNMHIAALAEIGIGIKLSDRWQINMDLYGSYSLNNVHDTYNTFIAMNRGYQGIVKTNLVSDIHPFSVGARIGISVYLGKPKEEILPPLKKRKLRGFNEDLNTYANQPAQKDSTQAVIATESINTSSIESIDSTGSISTIKRNISKPKTENLAENSAQPIALPSPIDKPTHAIAVETEIQTRKTAATPKTYTPCALNAPLLFHLNSLDLTEASSRIFKHMVSSLKNNPPKKIVIIGYTCDMGDYSDNIHLGKFRAERVKYLLEQQGLQHITIETETKGESLPHLPNTSEYNRQQNRCVDLIYIY